LRDKLKRGTIAFPEFTEGWRDGSITGYAGTPIVSAMADAEHPNVCWLSSAAGKRWCFRPRRHSSRPTDIGQDRRGGTIISTLELAKEAAEGATIPRRRLTDSPTQPSR
jgi:hypothetical protein